MADKSKRKGAAKAPISAHPAFPAIVALWFAALLGLGSLVLPVQLFERASEATGLASIVAAAQAPLGVTARIIIAAAACGIGATLGLVVAGQLAAASKSRPVRTRGPEQRMPAKRPISAHEEFGEADFADDAFPMRDAIPGRRRALSVNDESARSEFLEAAPLPGYAEPAPVAIEPDPVVAEEMVAEEIVADDIADERVADSLAGPLDLAAFDEECEPVAAAPVAPDTPARPPFADPLASAPFGTAALSRPGSPATVSVTARFDAEPSWQRAAVAPEPQPQSDPTSEEIPMRDFADITPAPPAASATHNESIAALVGRFARALEQHRENARADIARATQPTPEPVVDLTFALGTRAPEAAAPAPVAEVAPAPARALPTALQPVGWDVADDEHDEDDFAGFPALDLSLPRLEADRPFDRPFAEPVAAAVEDVEEDAPLGFDDDETEADDGYSSLLAMKNPATLPREAVRIEDELSDEDAVPEAVVVFPGQPAREASQFASPSPLRPFDAPAARVEALASAETPPRPFAPAAPATRDTERALREALEKLQRMSGAA